MVVEHLASLGHRRVARVAGPADLWHTELRTRAMSGAATECELAEVTVRNTDYSGTQGADATKKLLAREHAPTAIVYDNDVMALAGLTAAREAGMDIPAELSVVAWDDSMLCQLVHPQLSAVSRDIAMYGSHAAEQLLGVVAGDTVNSFQDATPQLVTRGSTAFAP